MRSLSDFRIFYNQNIAPELINLEHRRQKLLQLYGLSILLLAAILLLQVFIGVFFITLMLLLLAGAWIAYIAFRTRVWFDEYKPRIVGLVLDYMDNGVSYNDLKYQPKGYIDRQTFLSSCIFTTADAYQGEDYISGKIREMPFELSELRVQEYSTGRSKMDNVFEGIFLKGDFHRLELHESLLLLPDASRKYLSRSERAFHRLGGRRVHHHLLPAFEAYFDTYATEKLHLQEVLSTDFQEAILTFRQTYADKNQDKDLFMSIIGDDLYLAITQRRDLLEPNLFKPAVSFDKVLEFYDDLSMVFEVVELLDVMN